MNRADTQKRIAEFRRGLAGKSLEGALVAKRENCLYLSGFTGDSAYLAITQGEAFLVTDFRYTEQAEDEAPDYTIIRHDKGLDGKTASVFRERNIGRIGFEEDYISFKTYGNLSSELGSESLAPLEGLTETLRMYKDDYEKEQLKKAAEIADNAFDHILGCIRPGVTELEIAAELEYHMKKQGATGASFEIIVASGKRSSLPHGTASEKRIEYGDAVTLDFGAIYKNYRSDMTRTVFVGKPDEELKRIYETVLEAQLRALESIRAGLSGREADAVARDIIDRAGYKGCFGHGLGHGVGLEIHEEPRLSPSGGRILGSGMAVTVEPGIYIAGKGGVRIEDLVFITDSGPEILSRSPKNLIVL